MPKAAEPAPDYVPAEFAKQWEAVYKDAYAREMQGKDADDEDAQKKAASKGFAEANGVIKRRKEKASEVENMSDQNYATVGGKKVHRSDFGYAPPGSSPSEWKFPLDEEDRVRDAMSRFNQEKGIPHDAMRHLYHMILSRAHKYGMDTSDFEKKHGGSFKGSEEPAFVVLLAAGADGSRIRIPLALTGAWRRGTRAFKVTLDHLNQIRANFLRRKDGEINGDYDHASEMPEVAAGGPVPSSGLLVSIEAPEEFTDDQGRKRHRIWGLYEPTERARSMIASKELRRISPAINFHYKDKETGEDLGAAITSFALTNRPFLEEMPRVLLSEEGFELVDTGSVHVDGSDPNLSIDHKQPASAGKEGSLKMYQVRKLADGEHKGKHAVFDGDNMMGLAQVEPDADDQRRMMAAEEQFAQLLTDEGFKGQSRDEVRAVVAAGVRAQAKATEEKSHELLLSECIGPDGLDEGKASDLRADGKLTKEDYNAAREGQRRIANLIGQGKLLPRKAAGALRIFLYDRDLFKDQVEERTPHLPLKPIGVPLAADASGDFLQMVRDRQREKNIEYHIALSEISRENPALAKAYRDGVNSQQG